MYALHLGININATNCVINYKLTLGMILWQFTVQFMFVGYSILYFIYYQLYDNFPWHLTRPKLFLSIRMVPGTFLLLWRKMKCESWTVDILIDWFCRSFCISEETWWSFLRHLYLVLLNISKYKFNILSYLSSQKRVWCYFDVQHRITCDLILWF